MCRASHQPSSVVRSVVPSKQAPRSLACLVSAPVVNKRSPHNKLPNSVPSSPTTTGLTDQKLDRVSACLVPLLFPAPQAWPQCDLLVQYGVWRDSITAVVQIEPPAPEAGDALGTFALSVMPPGPEQSVCFPRDIIFVFDRSGSMTGGGGGTRATGEHRDETFAALSALVLGVV